jgi:glycosyltransferase involved in cell wall biosynthesis
LIPISRRLWKDGIKCDFRLVDSHGGPSRRTPEEMADWYNTGTVYLCSSSSEGTPNPALEAAASGCTIVSTPVGNMPELIQPGINGYLVDRSVDSLYLAVRQAVDNYREQSAAMQSRIGEWGWDRRAAAYFDLFRKLLASSPKKVRRRI